MDPAPYTFEGVKPKSRRAAESAATAPDPAAPGASAGEPTDVPYPLTLVRDESDAGWIATIDALPGCTARGSTPDEAVERASAAIGAWLVEARREGKDIPEPKTSQSHSGRLLLRMPQTLHAELARAAEREKVSLNQFITDVLAGALGWRSTGRKSQVTRAVRGLDGEDEAVLQPTGRAEGRPRLGTAVFVANGVVVALAAVVAIVVLVAVLLR